jgi:hypothetical protein
VPLYNRFHRGEWITRVSGGEGALDTPGPLNGTKVIQSFLFVFLYAWTWELPHTTPRKHTKCKVFRKIHICGASKIKLKKVNKKRTVTVRRVIIFLNISRHPLLIVYNVVFIRRFFLGFLVPPCLIIF